MAAEAPTSNDQLSPAVVVAGVALVALALVIVGWRYVFRFPLEPMVDLDVYKAAGRDLLHGRSLYSESDQRLVFTYPPFAALFAVVTAPFGRWLGQFFWALAIAAGTVYIVAASFRAALARVSRRKRWLVLGALSAVALFTHPLVENMFFGQINVLLVVLVLADLTVVNPRWPRGSLIGVATAIKLTPGIFAVHLWLTGRRRAAVTTLVAFLGCTVLVALIVPGSSWSFWTHDLFSTNRIGATGYTSNQSLFGVVSRVIPAAAVRPVWLVAALVVGYIGFVRAGAAHRHGDELMGIAIIGLLSTLVSPISWIHHFVWVIVAIGALAGNLRNRRRVAAAVALCVLFLLRLPWWGWAILGHEGLLHWIGMAMHNAYALTALGLVLFLPTSSSPVSAARPASPGVESDELPTMRA